MIEKPVYKKLVQYSITVLSNQFLKHPQHNKNIFQTDIDLIPPFRQFHKCSHILFFSRQIKLGLFLSFTFMLTKLN